MKLILLLLLILCNKVKGQFLDAHLINVNGKSAMINSIHMDFNLGESLSILTLFSKKNFLISTGNLQPNYESLPFRILDESTFLQVKWGPNPVSDLLMLRVAQEGVVVKSVQVSEVNGQIIHFLMGPFSGLNFNKQISFASVNTGIYFIQINYVVGHSSTKYKILKVLKI